MHVRRHLNRFFSSLRRKTREQSPAPVPAPLRQRENNSVTCKMTCPGTGTGSGPAAGAPGTDIPPPPPKKSFPFSQLNESIRHRLRQRGKGKGHGAGDGSGMSTNRKTEEKSLSRCQLLDLDSSDDQDEDNGESADVRRSHNVDNTPASSSSLQESLSTPNNDVISHENEIVKSLPGAFGVYTVDRDNVSIATWAKFNSCTTTSSTSTSSNFSPSPLPPMNNKRDGRRADSSTGTSNELPYTYKPPCATIVQVQVDVSSGTGSGYGSEDEARGHKTNKTNAVSVDDDFDKLLFEESCENIIKKYSNVESVNPGALLALASCSSSKKDVKSPQNGGTSSCRSCSSSSCENFSQVFIKKQSPCEICCQLELKKKEAVVGKICPGLRVRGRDADAVTAAARINRPNQTEQSEWENKIEDVVVALSQSQSQGGTYEAGAGTGAGTPNTMVLASRASKKKRAVKDMRSSAKRVRKAFRAGFISWAQSMTYTYSAAVFPDFYECPPMASLDYHNHDLEKSYPWFQHRHYNVQDKFGLQLTNPNQIYQMSY